VDDRSFAVLVPVVEGQLVQNEALAGVEADAQGPVLPGEESAVQREAGAFGLGDLDGPLGGAGGAGDRGVVEVPGYGGERDRAEVDDPAVTVRLIMST
jgi:hypothetical protein